MGKVLVVYATRTGETERIANLIAEGIRMEGSEASVKNVKEVKTEADLQAYDGYVFGCGTYPQVTAHIHLSGARRPSQFRAPAFLRRR